MWERAHTHTHTGTPTDCLPVLKNTHALLDKLHSHTQGHLVLQPEDEQVSSVEFKHQVEGVGFLSCFAFSCLYIFKEVITSTWDNKAIFMQLLILLLLFNYIDLLSCIDNITFNFEEIEKVLERKDRQ